MIGVRLPIASGFIWRQENRIAVKVKQGFIHRNQEIVHRSMKAIEFTYFSKDMELSRSSAHPNIFESTASYEFRRGNPSYDMFTQETAIMPLDGKMTTLAEAIGHLENDAFVGKFFGAAEILFDVPNSALIRAECIGTVRLNLAE
jgi:hypothetical protein